MTFTPPTREQRDAWLEHLGDAYKHAEIVRELTCLWETDIEPPPEPHDATGWLRIAAWNIERGRDPIPAALLLAATGADIALLTEVDIGMARTSNRDVARVIARALDAGVVFGIEFIELGLGKEADLVHIDADLDIGGHNVTGLHGNAILSRVPVTRSEVLRLDAGGEWFNEERREPRIGGRMAAAATISLDGTDVDVVSVHLESFSTAEDRAKQMKLLLEGVDARTKGPVVLAGDLNTFGAPLEALADRTTLRGLRAVDPSRFSWPAPHEPLFDVAAGHGFEWVDANLSAPTTRHSPDGKPDHHPLKLDWFLVRGLEVGRPTVVPAVASDGSPLSDHELIAVSVRVPVR
ncbi:MAG: endonuclease/exonuclease/phosphatase family protein [Actinomycetota bacterium]